MAKAYHLSAFGIWLKCTLVENKMKQVDLADKLEVSCVTVSRWISGNRNPKPEQLEKILDLFNCHIEILPNKEEE